MMKRYWVVLLALVACVAGCKTVPALPDAGKPPAIKSPALLEFCGVSWHEAIHEYTRASDEKRLPRQRKCVTWTCPLLTESLARTLPQKNCIRVCRAALPGGSIDVDFQSIVINDDGTTTLLDNEGTVVKFLNDNGSFFPKTQTDAEYILFAFSELCGYQFVVKPPVIPKTWGKEYDEKRKEVSKIDWSASWKTCDSGWIVSCVLITDHFAMWSHRYTILIGFDGRLKILKTEELFGLEIL